MHTHRMFVFGATLLTAGMPLADLAAQTTGSEYNAGFRAGRLVGRADIINNPSAHGLVSRTNIPAVRMAVPKNAAFTLNLGGTWTRYGLTGRDKAWRFNTNTGELRGTLVGTNERTVRLIPYIGSLPGPQMTIQLRPAFPDDAPQDAKRILRLLLKAVQNDNYSEFLQQGNASFRRVIPKERFSEAVRFLAADLRGGYDLSFLTGLTENGVGVYFWRFSFKSAKNKGLLLVRLYLKDGKADGILIDGVF